MIAELLYQKKGWIMPTNTNMTDLSEHPQLRAMHDNEQRRYRDKIGEPAWRMLKEIEAEHGYAAARKAARMLDNYLERGIMPKAKKA